MQKANVTLVLVMLAASAPAYADGGPPNEALVCRADRPELDKYAYLRAVSLDVRGHAPTLEEYAALDALEDVPPALIDEWLASEAFVSRAVRWHREMLWNNIGNVTLTNFRMGLSRSSDGIYWRSTPGLLYRGDRVACLNEPAQYNPDGSLVVTTAGGISREGYVLVHPYWAPDTEVKVCAFDAQEALVSEDGGDCTTSASFTRADCGCGPNLRLCRGPTANADTVDGFARDVDLRVAAVVREDLPYTELFTSRRAFVNGPMVHFLRYQTGVPANVTLTPMPYDLNTLPDLAYTDKETFVEVTLPPSHAGILTSPAYLLRFQSNRARANRYYNSFLCQPFQPPAGGIPLDPSAVLELDLQKRNGCKYCHAILEPAAAHWGRWAERSAGFLDPQAFPAQSDQCTRCALTGQGCTTECRRYYVTSALDDTEKPYLGMLYPYHFLRPDHQVNVELGPRYLMEGTVVDNRLPVCLARGVVERLAGRLVTDDERAWVTEALSRAFVQGGYSYRSLVRAMVLSPVYRRVR